MTKIVSNLPTRLAVAIEQAARLAVERDPTIDWGATVSTLGYLFARKPNQTLADLVPVREVIRRERPARLKSFAPSSLQQALRDNKPIRFGEGRE